MNSFPTAPAFIQYITDFESRRGYKLTRVHGQLGARGGERARIVLTCVHHDKGCPVVHKAIRNADGVFRYEKTGDHLPSCAGPHLEPLTYDEDATRQAVASFDALVLPQGMLVPDDVND